jgi:N-acetylmuramoyl-L-alanine amidase
MSASSLAAGWELLKIGGSDHVSTDSIRTFYGFESQVRTGNVVNLKNQRWLMVLRCGSQECHINNVKFVFSHPVVAQNGKVWVSRVDLSKLIDPVLRPTFIEKAGAFRTVILDPGHGGQDPGARNAHGNESNYNLRLANLVKARLEKLGYRVIMTRNSDRFLSLQQRVDFANSLRENAIFISIHFNSGGAAARGIETFTLSPPGVSHYGRQRVAGDFQPREGNEHDSANIALATAIHGRVLMALGRNTFDRGIKRARFSVLSGVRHPAILFEGGFMSHSQEARLIESAKYQEDLANGIVAGITRYRTAVSKAPAAAPGRIPAGNRGR